MEEKTINRGCDKSEGYLRVKENQIFENRYRAIEVIGKGVYSVVVRAEDILENREVALKIIREKYSNDRTELNVLKCLEKEYGHTSSFVRIYDEFMFENHLILVLECLEDCLFDLICFRKFRSLPLEYVSFIGNQLLSCCEKMKNLNLVHRDVKLENILLTRDEALDPNLDIENEGKLVRNSPEYVEKQLKNYQVKLVDFGTAIKKKDLEERFSNNSISKYSTYYVQSRYYRAPEIVLGVSYGYEVDTWSVAAVLGELYLGSPIFPGSSTYDIFIRHLDVLGIPPLSLLSRGTFTNLYFKYVDDNDFEKSQMRSEEEFFTLIRRKQPEQKKMKYYSCGVKDLIMSHSTKGRSKIETSKDDEMEKLKDLRQMRMKEEFADFLDRILKWDPKKRMDVIEAQKHPFITGKLF